MNVGCFSSLCEFTPESTVACLTKLALGPREWCECWSGREIMEEIEREREREIGEMVMDGEEELMN